MANKNTKVENTKVENTKVENTKVDNTSVVTDDNVSRETSVSGTENNVGQEIKAMGQDIVSTPTMTEDEHKEHMEKMFNYGLQGRLADMSLKVEIKTAYDKKEHLLDGYDDTTKSFYKWAEDKFELKETQVKQAIRVIPIFGQLDDKGYWSMEDKFKAYGLEKLDRIQSHPKFKLSDFDTFTEVLGITDKSTVADIKAIVAKAKGKGNDDTTGDNTTDTTGDNTTDTTGDNTTGTKKDTKKIDISQVKSSEAYKELDSKRDMLLKFVVEYRTRFKENREAVEKLNEGDDISELAANCMAIAFSFLDDFEELEKTYNEVGKNS